MSDIVLLVDSRPSITLSPRLTSSSTGELALTAVVAFWRASWRLG